MKEREEKERGSLDLVGETQSSLAHKGHRSSEKGGSTNSGLRWGEEQESRKGAEKAFGFLSYYLWALKCVTTRQK